MANKNSRKQAKTASPMVGSTGSASNKPKVVSAPVATTRLVKGAQPRVNNGRPFTLSHKELVSSVANSTTYVVNGGVTGNVYRLNPSNGTLFAWLPNIGSNFDQYRFTKMQLHYESFCSSTESGRVALYYDKDSQDPEPAERVELSNFPHLSESSPWVSHTLDIPVDGKLRFVNDSNVTDTKLVDLGQVGYVVYAGGSSNLVGEVRISYTIEFHEAQSAASLLQTLQTGTGAAPTGPRLVDVTTATGTLTTLTFRTGGVFLVSFGQRSLTFGALSAVGATINSSVIQQGTSAMMGIINVTVTTPGSTMSWSGTGMTTYVIEVTRARTSNSANLL